MQALGGAAAQRGFYRPGLGRREDTPTGYPSHRAWSYLMHGKPPVAAAAAAGQAIPAARRPLGALAASPLRNSSAKGRLATPAAAWLARSPLASASSLPPPPRAPRTNRRARRASPAGPADKLGRPRLQGGGEKEKEKDRRKQKGGRRREGKKEDFFFLHSQTNVFIGQRRKEGRRSPRPRRQRWPIGAPRATDDTARPSARREAG